MLGVDAQSRPRLTFVSCLRSLVVALALIQVMVGVRALDAQDRVSGSTEAAPITITADFAHEWQQPAGPRVMMLRGRCRIQQGNANLQADKMVIWHISQKGRDRIAVYLEENARAELAERTVSRSSQFVDLVTQSGIEYRVARRNQARYAAKDAKLDGPRFDVRRPAGITSPLVSDVEQEPLFQRAIQRMLSSRQSQIQQAAGAEDGRLLRNYQLQQMQSDERRIRLFPRHFNTPFDLVSRESKNATPPEQVSIISGGVNMIIDGVKKFGTVDMKAERMVVWTQSSNGGLTEELLQSSETPFQVYLEGDIVIRQSNKILRANRAFFDARENRALLLDAELSTYLPDVRVRLRVRAEQIRQLSEKSFHAQEAWVTSSEFGLPGYRVQSTDVFLEPRHVNPWVFRGKQNRVTTDPFSGQQVDPATGAPVANELLWVTALNNSFYLENIPVLYTPYLSSFAEDPGIPIRRASARYDRIFGAQAQVVWDVHKLFGMDTPADWQWDLYTDLYSHRGPAIGTGGSYQGADRFGLSGNFSGELFTYYLHDDGEDNLGADRRSLVPEDSNRGRILLRHQHTLPFGMSLSVEGGYVSDRNFLEQYFEDEFDGGKDQETLVYLKQSIDNWAWTGLIRPQANDFATTTEWLPKGDFYALSEPLFGSIIRLSSHSSAGYANLRQGDPPSDSRDLFTPLPFIANATGAVLMTRHELTAPFQSGPAKVVPYAMGEAAHWGEGFNGEDVNRLIGRIGVRSSFSMWRVFPYIESRILNLHGLAHRMTFETDASITDADESLNNIPQFNEFDDNAQERFRQRFLFNTFGGALPNVFEPRMYAVRTGAGGSVTSPYHELVDDQRVVRLAWRHRLQTKVGPPDRLRIKDWMTLDLEASYFPKKDRDNFGEDFGLLGGRYRWYVGDRTSLLASAYYDLFDNAQQLWDIGVLTSRTTRGSMYLGVRQVKGAGLDSQIATANLNYAMSPKWITSVGTAYDIAENMNRGQWMRLSRVGADFIFHIGAGFDQSKDNATLAISIEPRIGPFDFESQQFSSLLNIMNQR